MKKNVFSLFIVIVSLLSVVFYGCSPSESALDELHERFQDSYEQAKVHSTTLTLLKNRIQSTTRSMGQVSNEVLRSEACQAVKTAYFEQEKEAILCTEEAYEYITLENPIAVSDVYTKYKKSFFDELTELVEKGENEKNLMKKIELLLYKYKSDENHEVYMGLAAVALDSYVFWKDNIGVSTYSVISVITSVVKADVLSAASFVLYSGAVALYTAVATGGTSVLPTVAAVAGRAAFGSAVRGIAYFF